MWHHSSMNLAHEGRKRTLRRSRIYQSMQRIVRRIPGIRSLRLRIFLFTFLVGAAACIIMRWSILYHYENRVLSLRTSAVQTQLLVLANHLLTYDYMESPDNEVIRAELSQFASFYDGRVLVVDDDLTVTADTFDMATGKTILSADVVECLNRGMEGITSSIDREDGFIEVIVPIVESIDLESIESSAESIIDEENTTRGVLLAAVSTDAIDATIGTLTRTSTNLEIIMLLLTAFITFFVSGHLVAPFRTLAAGIGDVRSGFSDEDVHVDRYTETERISNAFNQVLGRMRALDQSRQDFVSNVSHELKTPMTSMKVLADSLLQQGEGVPEEMYREFLADIDSELDRENSMIAELMQLAKMDRRQVPMNITRVNIGDLLEIILKRVRPIAQQQDIELTLVVERPAVASVDEVKLTTAFTNLIENAVKYNRPHGKVIVTLNTDHQNFILTVEDTGIGIPQDSIGRVFERFYRVDKSRSREVGGTGLGLSLAKSAVLLHKGSIEVRSTEGVGTVFTVTIPLNYIENPQQ